MFYKMSQKKSSDNGVSALRRSPRFLHVNSAKLQKRKSRKKRESPSQITTENDCSSPPLRSIENVSWKRNFEGRLEKFFSENLVGSVGGSESFGKSINGSSESARKADRVEGFQGLRRSLRFSSKENVSESICKKTKPDGVISSLKIVGKDGSRGVQEVLEKAKMQQCKENFGVQVVKKMPYSTRLSSPFRSLENTFPTETIQANPQKNAKSLVGGTKKSMESITGSGKFMGKIKEIEGFPGRRRSQRFSSLGNILDISEKHSKDKSNVVKGENAEFLNYLSANLSNKGVFLEVSNKENSEKHQRKFVGMMGSKKIVEKGGLGFNSSEECMKETEGGRRPSCAINPEVMPHEGREKSGGNINTGVEKKSNQCEENVGPLGWTNEQEVALQRAYFVAKPSPHFWKKVSKLVPGKSAQECFDRVHSSFPTPPQRPPRSKAKRTNSSPLGDFSLSGSKLLEPTDLGTKRLRRNKEKKCYLQKTARHLLQKHSTRDQGYEADLFSIFEPTTNASSQALLQTEILPTPDCAYKKHGFLQECHEKSASTNKNPLSRFNSSSGTPLASPLVLKQIKNVKLHERYIDQLHRREARRTEGRKCITAQKDRMPNHVQKTGMVKAAKDALVSDARDMISKFKHLQANAMSDNEDFDDDYNIGVGGDEYEEES